MNLKKILEKIWNWLKVNRLVAIYFVFATVIETVAVLAVEGSPFMTRPFLSLGLLFFICGVLLLVKSNRARLIIGAILIGLQIILDLVFSVIFDMTGQYFDFGMLNLRNDAFATLEGLSVDFITFYVGLLCCILYIVYGLRMTRKHKKVTERKRSAFFYAGLSLAGVATMGISFVAYYPRNTNKYEEMINGKAASAYSAYGMIGNVVGELLGAVFQDKSSMPSDQIDEFIYKTPSSPTEYFGKAKGKNVVVILAESLEWFAFMNGDEYPNALGLSDGDLQALYPNLWEFYQGSVAMTNFHSREKTDISETLSVMGCYPTDAYINYEYADNEMPYTVPNILKQQNADMQFRSFHNGFKTFYNRDDAHKAFGFEYLTDMYDMEKKGMKNYMEDGERNLDSDMIRVCKDEMFPTDKPFFTYITTITMHGVYYERDNLETQRNKLLEKVSALYEGATEIKQKDDEGDPRPAPYCYMTEEEEILFHYMTTVIELDNAIGCMMEDLENKGLLDNTVIAMFGDHNTYYQQLSNYVKDIDDYDTTRKYTDLYNVPLMIRDSGIGHQVIDKFTCTSDIAPTILDLLGVRYYENMFYGRSVFSDKTSALYSRAYDIFVGDGIVGTSVNKLVYRSPLVTDDQLTAFKTEATALVEKIKHCDYIFKQNHFGKDASLAKFRTKMQEINS